MKRIRLKPGSKRKHPQGDNLVVLQSQNNQALSILWARKRLGRLSDFTADSPYGDAREEIATLGLTYNLLTSETAFIAVHETVRNHEGPAESVAQPLPLPRHVSGLAVGGRRVPEPELVLLLVAAALTLCAVRRRSEIGGRISDV